MKVESYLYQYLCPYSPTFKQSLQQFHSLETTVKVSILAITLFTGISSFFIGGLLALPVFTYVVDSAFTSQCASILPENYQGLTDDIRGAEHPEIANLAPLIAIEWEEDQMFDIDNNLLNCYQFMSQPEWCREDLSYEQLSEYVQTFFNSNLDELLLFIRSANLDQLIILSTFFVKSEKKYQQLESSLEKTLARRRFESFVCNANSRVLDTWIQRVRELIRNGYLL